MDQPKMARLVQTALRCYPARWRHRHGAEAADLAALLIRDGTPAGSIALSYLAGAAREWLVPRPSRRLTAAAGVLLAATCTLGVCAGLLASTAPAKAASTSYEHGRAHCRRSPQPVPRLTPAKGHPHVITSEAGRDRSC